MTKHILQKITGKRNFIFWTTWLINFLPEYVCVLDAANSQPSSTPNAAAPKEFDPLSKEDGSRNKVASSFGLQDGKTFS